VLFTNFYLVFVYRVFSSRFHRSCNLLQLCMVTGEYAAYQRGKKISSYYKKQFKLCHGSDPLLRKGVTQQPRKGGNILVGEV